MATRNDRGALLFTADDFENEEELVDDQQPEKGDKPASKPRKDDVEIIVEDDDTGGEQPGTVDNQPRFPNDETVHESLRGKSLAEAAELFTGLRTIASNALTQAQQIQQQYQNQNQPPAGRQPSNEDSDLFGFTDEDFGVGADPKAFGKKLEAKLNEFAEAKLHPYQISQMHTQSVINQQNAASLPYWELFGNDIIAAAQQLPVNVTASPATWQALHDRFVAMNIDKVHAHIQAKAAKPKPGFTEISNGASAQEGGDRPGGKRQVKVTRAQLDMAKALGVDPKQLVNFI